MTITIIGTGFVGVVTSAVFASFGHTVIGLDVDQKKVDSLKKSKVPFYEPNLENLLKDQQINGNLSFTTNYKEAIEPAQVIMIAVGTPSAPDGQADLKYVLMAAESLADHLQENAIVVVKSTVPPGTLDKVKSTIEKKTKVNFYTASLPEFLKEGSAVDDTLNPDRVVIGADVDFVFDTLEDLHKPFKAPIIKISPESAQMAKYSANAYLATRITFVNQIADLCDKNGADVQEVIKAMGHDARIGQHYWYPGFGYGGSCFPKDVKELAAYSRAVNESHNLFNKVNDLNNGRIERLMDKFAEEVDGWDGKTVAVLGLSFKPNTDDMREAPSIKVIDILSSQNTTIKGYDPKALKVAPQFIKKSKKLGYYDNIEEAVKDADVIISLIEWPQIVSFDYSKTREKSKPQWFIDGRNQFDPDKISNWGYTYLGIGRRK